MSRRPGIAAGWYDKYSADVYPADKVVVRGKAQRPPRMYRDWETLRDWETSWLGNTS